MGLVLLFTALLVALGVLYGGVLKDVLEARSRDVLEEEWGAVKGYLRFEKNRPVWFFDKEDPEEAAIVDRLRRIYLLTEADGTILEVSPAYRILGIDSNEDIQRVLKSGKAHWETRMNSLGRPYLIRSGEVIDARKRYFLAIARPVSDEAKILHDFVRNYFTLLPVVILATSLFGWFLARRALQPVTELARTAQRVSASNLNTEIPLRRAGDELDHLIESFNRMIERLSQSFEQIRRFSTDVSHELRTPLTAIRGQLEVALFTARKPEQYHEAMINALEDVERLSAIVKSLLLLSQAESGQLVLQKTRLDLGGIIDEIVDQFQIPADEARIRLKAETAGGCITEADRIQIERLISNLLSNALKYTPAGGDVTVRLRRTDRKVILEVEDTGVGIPAENLPHIFDRFYRVRSGKAAAQQGLGLGLSFVAWIAKAHEGTVEVESSEGRGTTFTVTLPAAPQPAPTEVIAYNEETTP